MKTFLITEDDAAALDMAIDTLRELIKSGESNENIWRSFHLVAGIIPKELPMTIGASVNGLQEKRI